MENKNGLNALLVPGAHLDEYIKAVAAQYRSDLTATYGTLQKAVALLEDMARGGYTPEKQQAVQHIAYVMMCYTTSKDWGYDSPQLDDAKEIGCLVKDLPLDKRLLELMGDYGEVPTSCHVDGTTMEVAYWCVQQEKPRDHKAHGRAGPPGVYFCGPNAQLGRPERGLTMTARITLTSGELPDGTPIEPGTALTDAGAAKLAPLLAELFKAALAAEERTKNDGNAGT